ncbi:LysR family transcriptional regulator [Pseudomonas sp. RIT-To-2]|uniref:LysR family transcriptional regulator n=1 Tax=Pseudomonas sp. RIT-To-2 TaxID=3462541 RepID=UPI002413AE3F
MDRNEIGDLLSFTVVAKELSFTRAAARLETSQSAVSQTIRRLEARLGVRLLARTTRSMAITPAGQRLLDTLGPAFGMINATLGDLNHMRDSVAGTIRITSSTHAAQQVLWPIVARLVKRHPDIEVEICADGALTDIVKEGFDAGVRLGQQVERDMVAMRISADMRLIVVGTPEYLRTRSTPVTPQELTRHTCINVRLSTSGALYAWEFHGDGRDLRVRVTGTLIFNSTHLVLQAALEGHGLGMVFEDVARPYIEQGKLIQVLDDWSPEITGYHLYYPSRREHSAAFQALLDELKGNMAALL